MLSLSSLNKSAKHEEISHSKEKKMTSFVKVLSTVCYMASAVKVLSLMVDYYIFSRYYKERQDWVDTYFSVFINQ